MINLKMPERDIFLVPVKQSEEVSINSITLEIYYIDTWARRGPLWMSEIFPALTKKIEEVCLTREEIDSFIKKYDIDSHCPILYFFLKQEDGYQILARECGKYPREDLYPIDMGLGINDENHNLLIVPR